MLIICSIFINGRRYAQFVYIDSMEIDIRVITKPISYPDVYGNWNWDYAILANSMMWNINGSSKYAAHMANF